MSPRIRALARVQRTRKKLRDAAAGELLAAEQASREASARELEAHANLERVLDEATERLSNARSVTPFFELGDHRDAATRQIIDAQQSRRGAEHAAAARRAYLATRERELRRTEKLLDREKERFLQDQSQAEQKQQDDQTAARLRRPS